MGYYSYDSDASWGQLFLSILLLVVVCMISSCSNDVHIDTGRKNANMVCIQEGYCYDADTKIIYRETIVNGGKYYDTPTYMPYINENGNYCKYEYGKWVEFIRTP